jgi:two-component system, OmpR family, copper resistance phosphate regulon response regulator CusR
MHILLYVIKGYNNQSTYIPMKILIVEDEIKLNTALAKGLQGLGYAVDSAFDGEEGEKMARLNNYDLIILDVMMPKRTGIEVCRNLRASFKPVPILMLTAKDAIEDKVEGLDIGADDYLTKPFSFDELTARIRTLLRRPPLTATDIFSWEDLTLDTRTQKVMIQEKEIVLTLREYGLLEYLLRNQGSVLTRVDLLEHVWDRNYDSLSNVVDVHLKNLRKKLPKKYATRIKTVWGKGYQLI